MTNFPSIEPVRVFLASESLQLKYKMPNRTKEMGGGGGESKQRETLLEFLNKFFYFPLVAKCPKN